MKNSNKVLLGIGIAAVVIVAAVVITARLIYGSIVIVPAAGNVGYVQPSGTDATRSFDLTGFDGVTASGAWDLTVKQGDAYSVVVTVPDNLLDRLDVRTNGSSLNIGMKSGTTLTNWRMKAAITMPSLESVRLSGANKASFEGFSGNRLEVECSGAAAITASGQGYKDLLLNASGASTGNFRNLPVVSAKVHISGAGQAELQMEGGTLGGELSGAARVTYWGNVSGQTIQTSGIGGVTHRT